MININEIVMSPTQQYLLIHKTGCTTVVKGLRALYGEENVFMGPQPVLGGGPLWTTVRDPYSRFISGLAYDISRSLGPEHFSSLHNLRGFIRGSFNPSKYLSPYVHPEYRKEGRVKHAIPQVYYLYNCPIDVAVRTEELDLFCQVHFGTTILENKGSSKEQEMLKSVIEEDEVLHSSILHLLEADYQLLDYLDREGKLWRWAEGKVF